MPFVISCLYMAKPELLSHCYIVLLKLQYLRVPIIMWLLCTFSLVVAWDLLEDRHI